LARFLVLRAVRVRHERLASFVLRERLKEVDDLVQFGWVHRDENLPRFSPVSFQAKSKNPVVQPTRDFSGMSRVRSR
jgi:hypothetical protein